MKFDEKKWRTLAANKPDELHSYIPQSSICELFDEIERLEREIAKCKEANRDAQSRLDDYRQDYAKVVNDLCPTDERHCGCVPILRRENRLISEELADAKDELKHRRDALIDAQRIYNKANEQKVHYLSALQFIASFVNAKDKTTVDDLIAIASKEIDAEGDQIVDACNYWVSKLRDKDFEIQDLKAENERLSQMLHDELSQLEIATDLGNKRWVALNEIYEDGEKHNANWCKRKAQEGLGIKNA